MQIYFPDLGSKAGLSRQFPILQRTSCHQNVDHVETQSHCYQATWTEGREVSQKRESPTQMELQVSIQESRCPE